MQRCQFMSAGFPYHAATVHRLRPAGIAAALLLSALLLLTSGAEGAYGDNAGTQTPALREQSGPPNDMRGRAISLEGLGGIRYDCSLNAGADPPITVTPVPPEGPPCAEGPAVEGSGSPEEGALRDWEGIRRDTAYFFGYQFLVIGVLYVLPEDVTGWTSDKKKSYDFDKWVQNVTHPVWDSDKWYLNYLGHPYWGATYYIRARERGFNQLESFFYSAFLSAMFEFGVEALFEPPAYQDLIVTPVLGTLLGMYVFEPVREQIKAKGPEREWYDDLALVLTDPLGAVSELTDRVLGIKSSVKVTHPGAGRQRCAPAASGAGNVPSCRASYTGVNLTFQW